jgi:hypothetical protein
MGMFDNLIVDLDILPEITEEDKNLLRTSNNFQTKAFENTLTTVYITKDESLNFRHSFTNEPFLPYKLQIKESEWEEVPKEERPYPNAEGFRSLMGCMREVNVRVVDLDYTGTFTFYDFVNYNEKKWFEFEVETKNGKIISIKLVREN